MILWLEKTEWQRLNNLNPLSTNLTKCLPKQIKYLPDMAVSACGPELRCKKARDGDQLRAGSCLKKEKKKNKERSICLHKDLNFHVPSSSYLLQLRPRKSSTVHCLIKLILKLWHAHVTGLGNKTEWSKNGLSSPKGLCTMTSLYKTKKQNTTNNKAHSREALASRGRSGGSICRGAEGQF